jgi:lipopolysaccharide export system permease protein
VGPLTFAVTTLTSLLLLNYISKRFQDLVGKGLGWNVIAEFFVLSIPFVVAMTLPMAVLIATLYAFSRLAADSEITALMANGVGTRQLMTPVAGAGLALSLAMVGFNDQVLPRANLRLSSLQASIAQKKPTLALRAQTMNEVVRDRVYIQMARLDVGQSIMHDVTIHDMNDVQLRRTIIADSGLLALAPNGRDLLLTLYDGYVQETRTAEADRMQRVFFHTNVLRVPDVENQLTRSDEPGYKGDREMSVCDLQQSVARERGRRDSLYTELTRLDTAAANVYRPRRSGRIGEWYCAAIAALAPVRRAEAQEAPRQADTIPPRPPGLPRGLLVPGLAGRQGNEVANPTVVTESLRAHLRRAEESMSGFEVEIHKKFAISVACLIFALLGPPIALRFPRGGVGLTIGVSLSVFAIYYIGLIAGEELANTLKVTPFVAMWAANVLLGTIAIVLVAQMGRTGPSHRSPSLVEILDRLLPWRRRRWPA